MSMIWGFLLISLFSGFVLTDKVCTNSGVPSPSPSHTLRFQSNNSSMKKRSLDRLRLGGAASDSIPRKILREEISWNILHRKTAKVAGGGPGGFLKEVSLHDVRLDPGSVHGVAQQTNLEYLLMLDVDSLVWSFRKTAGLETSGDPYGGWEAPDVELRGHFVGHYMSASAHMWASTHNSDIKQKMISLVSALSHCQKKIGTGYLSAFPSELFDRFEALEDVWAPYYTIHKILAGLLDQYTLAGSGDALNMATWMVDYFYKRVQKVISKFTIERQWQSLNEETGGMNHVLYRLYIITGDQKHLLLGHLFDKPCFLGLLAMKADDISGFHANTHIPIVIGAQLRYEITGEPLYKEIGTAFMDIVNSSHSYATGGTSTGEFWSDPKRLATTLQTENQESCTTYNMLKVSRNLFRWTKEMAYADHYERALTNGVLGIQRGTEPGVMIYMLPLKAGGSKARGYHGWGTKFHSFWCCYGTGIESFSKLGDSIYFEEEGKDTSLYVIQYISSTLNWKSGKVVLTQRVEPVVSWDQTIRVTFTISSEERAKVASSTLKLRVPIWTQSNASNVSLNGKQLSLPAPGNFFEITKSWGTRDEISLHLPLIFRSEAIQDDRNKYASLKAFHYGPYLLAGLSSGDWDIKIDPDKSLSTHFAPIASDYNSQLITLAQESENSTFVLTNSGGFIKMEKHPEPGTDSAIKSTFRLIHQNLEPENSPETKLVMLELFDFPGTFLSNDNESDILGVSDMASSVGGLLVFRLGIGLDGEKGSVSLESDSRRGCFIYSELVNGLDLSLRLSTRVKLECSSGLSDPEFQRGTSFLLQDGISRYDRVSFVAKGMTRNYLLVPLLSLRDESYTVYFNVS